MAMKKKKKERKKKKKGIALGLSDKPLPNTIITHHAALPTQACRAVVSQLTFALAQSGTASKLSAAVHDAETQVPLPVIKVGVTSACWLKAVLHVQQHFDILSDSLFATRLGTPQQAYDVFG